MYVNMYVGAKILMDATPSMRGQVVTAHLVQKIWFILYADLPPNLGPSLQQTSKLDAYPRDRWDTLPPREHSLYIVLYLF